MSLTSKIQYYTIQVQRIIDHLYRRVFGLPQLKRSQITPALYLGGQYFKNGMKTLQQLGVTGIVSMREHALPPVSAYEYFQVLHLPTPDQHAPSMTNLLDGISFIKQEIDKGGKVYVHCRFGEGRGPTMAAAYLISTGMTVDDAITLIKKVRTFVAITPPQYAQLQKLEKKLSLINQEHDHRE